MSDQSRMNHGWELRGLDLFSLENWSPDLKMHEARFGLMFKLDPFAPDDELLIELGNTMTEPPGTDRDSRIPAGLTYLGQFIDHDLTFDPTPLPARLALTNYRTPRFDLDSVYEKDPTPHQASHGDCELPRDLEPPRDPADNDKLQIATFRDPDRPVDLPRLDCGTAIIGDPRNDENLLVAQLHLVFLKFHNKLVDHVRQQDPPPASVFAEARRLARWHYQWIVVNEFLPGVVGRDMVDQILTWDGGVPQFDLKCYQPNDRRNPMMPVEFAVAAYRFGHSMVRPKYFVRGTNVASILGPYPTEDNLNGSRPLIIPLEVEWKRFFQNPDATTGPNNVAKKIDAVLSGPLAQLPLSILPTGEPRPPRQSLAVRNLLRGKQRCLPSGQRVAIAMQEKNVPDVRLLSNAELGLPNDSVWDDQAPLWFYVLKEAALHQNGERLGTVGGRIVAEVFLGLIAFDSDSYLNRDPGFRPSPPIATTPGRFTMWDLLRYIGAVPSAVEGS